jgi:8-oxo-dGTP pyrophosphatase MutT (NUDIX family)
MLMLREREGVVELLLIKRAEDPRDPWSGHIALPGGRAEPSDESLLATAIRETREEVGIDLDTDGDILGQLDPLHPANPQLPRILVTPLVATVRSNAATRLSNEVQFVFWMSLDSLAQTGRTATVERTFERRHYSLPAYPSPHGPVWGLTERILTQFLALL